MTSRLTLAPLEGAELGDYGLARVRDVAFDAVQRLWRRRQAEGMNQKQLAARISRDPATVSRNLRAPGNWTLRTFGELVQALNGNVRIIVEAAEDTTPSWGNYDAYDEHDVNDDTNVIRRSLHFSPGTGVGDAAVPTGAPFVQPAFERTHG